MSSRRQLAVALDKVAGFDEPERSLEQYMTTASVAASLIHEADLRGDLNRRVIDLGTGTGMLAIAAASRTQNPVIGMDIDHDALTIAIENRDRLDVAVEFVGGSIDQLPLCPSEPATVLMNPPFGAQRDRRGADRRFLEVTRQIATVSYSIHNAESAAFIEAYCDDYGGTITDAYALELDLPAQFEFHEADLHSIDAEAYRIEW